MSSYLLNGSATSIAPATILWQPNEVGTDHNGAPVYSQYWNVQLNFDAAIPTEAFQWLNNATGTSVSLTIPNRWSDATFTTFSPVYLKIMDAPVYETVNMMSFGLLATRVLPAEIIVLP